MRTNTFAQQTARRMTPAQKAATLALRIEADHAVNIAHLADYHAKRDLWQAAEAAGLTPAELHQLDMELAQGADVTALLADLRQF